MSELITISEMALKLGVHIDTLRQWEEKGYISPHYTKGGHRRYSISDMKRLIERHTLENEQIEGAKTLWKGVKELEQRQSDDSIEKIFDHKSNVCDFIVPILFEEIDYYKSQLTKLISLIKRQEAVERKKDILESIIAFDEQFNEIKDKLDIDKEEGVGK